MGAGRREWQRRSAAAGRSWLREMLARRRSMFSWLGSHTRKALGKLARRCSRHTWERRRDTYNCTISICFYEITMHSVIPPGNGKGGGKAFPGWL